MPIDFAAIAARYREQLAFESRRALIAQRAISPVLSRRRRAAAAVEQATRDFPIVRFYNGAPTLRLTPAQRGTLELASPPPSVIEGVARGGLGFLEGFRALAEPFSRASQETAIVRFARGFDQALAEVEASIERFERPSPAMFDPDQAQARDLAGIAALGFRTLAEASRRGGELERLTAQLRVTLDIAGAASRGSGTAGATAAEEAPRSLPEQMDAVTRQLLGGGLILGILPELIAVLLEGVAVRIRVWILDALTAIERIVLDFRADVLREVFEGLVGRANSAIDIAGAVYEIVGANVRFALRFATAVGQQFAEGVRDFAGALGGYFRDWIRVLRWVPDVIRVIVGFDLTELLRSSLGRVVSVIPSLSLSNLLDANARHVNIALREVLLAGIDAAERAVEGGAALLGPAGQLATRQQRAYVRRQARRARWLARELFPGASFAPGILGTLVTPPRVEELAEAPALRFRSQFPDLYETLLGGGRGQEVVAIVDRIGRAAEQNLSEGLRRARDGLGTFGTVFSDAAAAAGRGSGLTRLRRAGAEATALGERAFGPEVARERRAAAGRPADAVAQAFEGWLADGGFMLIGEAIPVYVAEMARYWREQVERGEELTAPITATSPHILRRRAQLGRVVMPRLTLRTAAGRALDERFADAVAAEFAAAVQQAFAAGQGRLRELAATGGS